MAGWLTNQVPQLVTGLGAEIINADTGYANGATPQMGAYTSVQLALALSWLNNKLDKTMVAGSRYFTSVNIQVPQVFTGASVEVGTTGGTDLWNIELHSPTGVTLATTLLTGTTAGTANTWQQIAFASTYTLTVPGQYWLVLQSNGTTAKFASINTPTSVLLTGSATGTLGTAASITPPTTYTANLGPRILLY